MRSVILWIENRLLATSEDYSQYHYMLSIHLRFERVKFSVSLPSVIFLGHILHK